MRQRRRPDAAFTDVNRTALGVASVRAGETRRPDPLFRDPLAQAFLDEARWTSAAADHSAPDRTSRLAFHAVIRTRFYDDYLLAAMADSRQVVLLAAGLDTRAYRLTWPDGVRVFEVDQPAVLEFKERVLGKQAARPSAGRTVVPADLTGDWPPALTSAGFDPAARTAWLVEGLLAYLSPDEAGVLLETVGALSAPGSRLATERTRARPSLMGGRISELWRGGLGEDAVTWLERHGWTATGSDLADVAAFYGRPIDPSAVSGFATAVRAG